MPSFPKCMTCKAAMSQVVLFELLNGRWLPPDWDGGSPNVCESCAASRVSLHHEKVLGYLFPNNSKVYCATAFQKNTYREQFIRKGIVVIPQTELPGSCEFTDTIRRIVDKRRLLDGKKLQPLGDAVISGKKSKHICRKWKNIWGDTVSLLSKDNQARSILEKCEFLGLQLEHHLFPEIYYGRRMVKHSIDSSLRCNKINLLARFAGLETTQHLHQDCAVFSLAVIYVVECNNNGYSFTYFEGSHELSYKFDNIEKANINITKEDMKTIHVKKGHFICFASNLVHAGGPASLPLGPNEGLKQLKLSDMSLHFDFSHDGLSKGAIRSNGDTLTWPYEPNKEDPNNPGNFSNVFKYQGESPKFREAASNATTSWILDSQGKGVVVQRKSKRLRKS